MKSIAVIGAGYGDEGKGLMTDYFSREISTKYTRPIVARGNGGAQAGHTVVTPDGKRHVFSHIGAGTLNGSSTYLGENFLVNPIRFRQEVIELKHLGIQLPSVYAHPNAFVTTIFDMMINQMIETHRGKNRHGSCGMGINETLVRSINFPVNVIDMQTMKNSDALKRALHTIKYEWVPDRLKELGIATEENLSKMETIDVIELALDMMSAVSHIIVSTPRDLAAMDGLIVESGQGLLLDETMGAFPHVTPSNTGLISAIKIASELNVHTIKPMYITRAYVTRHGQGPMNHEGQAISTNQLYDNTNDTNEWQGSLRYAPLDVRVLFNAITRDMLRAQEYNDSLGIRKVKIEEPQFVITHMDQMSEKMGIVCDLGGLKLAEMESKRLPAFLDVLGEMHYNNGLTLYATSYGPTHKDVKKFKREK